MAEVQSLIESPTLAIADTPTPIPASDAPPATDVLSKEMENLTLNKDQEATPATPSVKKNVDGESESVTTVCDKETLPGNRSPTESMDSTAGTAMESTPVACKGTELGPGTGGSDSASGDGSGPKKSKQSERRSINKDHHALREIVKIQLNRDEFDKKLQASKKEKSPTAEPTKLTEGNADSGILPSPPILVTPTGKDSAASQSQRSSSSRVKGQRSRRPKLSSDQSDASPHPKVAGNQPLEVAKKVKLPADQSAAIKKSLSLADKPAEASKATTPGAVPFKKQAASSARWQHNSTQQKGFSPPENSTFVPGRSHAAPSQKLPRQGRGNSDNWRKQDPAATVPSPASAQKVPQTPSPGPDGGHKWQSRGLLPSPEVQSRAVFTSKSSTPVIAEPLGPGDRGILKTPPAGRRRFRKDVGTAVSPVLSPAPQTKWSLDSPKKDQGSGSTSTAGSGAGLASNPPKKSVFDRLGPLNPLPSASSESDKSVTSALNVPPASQKKKSGLSRPAESQDVDASGVQVQAVKKTGQRRQNYRARGSARRSGPKTGDQGSAEGIDVEAMSKSFGESLKISGGEKGEGQPLVSEEAKAGGN